MCFLATHYSPAFTVDDVVQRTPARMDDRRKRAIGRVAERDEAHAEAILGEVRIRRASA